MVKNTFIALLCSFLIFSCNDDAGPALNFELSYDGDNQSGPVLAAGDHELAVKFTSTETADYLGKTLDEVTFFVGFSPANCVLKIYGQGNAIAPGTVLYEEDLTGTLTDGGWNQVILPSPIEITEEDIWISIAVTHSIQQQSIGCDAGPNRSNGDWLFSAADGEWNK